MGEVEVDIGKTYIYRKSLVIKRFLKMIIGITYTVEEQYA